jgi:hypothetical protein
MGIITEAVIANLQSAITKLGDSEESLKAAKQSLSLIRNPITRRITETEIEEILSRISIVKKGCKDQLKIEIDCL